MGPPPRSALPDPVSTQTTKLHFTGHDNPRQHSDGFYRPGASAIAGSSGDRLPAGPQAPMRGSVAKTAAAYNNPGDDAEVEEIYFTKSPGEPLHDTQFLWVVPNDNFTRMGWEQPGVAFEGLIDREVRQWILPFTNIADFSSNREQWHSRWMQAGICRSSLLCLEEHGFYLMLLKCMATRVMGSPERFAPQIAQKTLTMAHVCGGQLKKELAVGGTFTLKPAELPYFHDVLLHVRSIVDLEYPFQGDWTVINWLNLPTDSNPKPDTFVGASRFL